MTRGRRRVVALGLFAGALLLMLSGGPGEAQTAIETGWWWKGNPGSRIPLPDEVPVPATEFPTTPPSLPPPPNVGEGLMVAALPDGAVSVAAVRASFGAESLTLAVAENGNFGGQVAHLIACVAPFPWNPNAGGRWDDKPIVACDLSNGGGSVAGIPSADFSTWTFPVAPLLIDGKTDVVIVPTWGGVLPEGLLEPFQLVFKVPTLEAFVLSPTIPSVDDVDTPARDTTSDDIETGVLDPSEIVGDQSYAPVASAALPPASQAPRLFAPATALGDDTGDTTAQLLAVVLLLLCAGALWMTSQQAVPAPISLARVAARPRTGPTAPPTVGGLGRFERTRSGKPPSLF